jgi:hypothetical protein
MGAKSGGRVGTLQIRTGEFEGEGLKWAPVVTAFPDGTIGTARRNRDRETVLPI